MRLPPHGKTITARIAHGNPPDFVAVCVGLDSWQRAKARNEGVSDMPAMVLPPGEDPHKFIWPVAGSVVIIEVDIGPSKAQLNELAAALLTSGAASVASWWPQGHQELTRYFPKAISNVG